MLSGLRSSPKNSVCSMHHRILPAFMPPGVDRNTGCGNCCGSVVLGREMLQDDQVTSAPGSTSVSSTKRLNRHAGIRRSGTMSGFWAPLLGRMP